MNTNKLENKHLIAIDNYKKGRYQEVIKYCNGVMRFSKSPDLYHLLGMAKYRNGRIEEALINIKEAIRIEDNERYRVDLGDIYKKIKEYRLALDQYNAALKINPNNVDACLKSAHAFQLMRLFPSAFKMAVFALSLDQENVKIKLLLAKCLDEMHDFTEALRIYDEIIIKGDASVQVYLDKADLLRRMFRYDEALECSEVVFKKDSNNINYYLLMSTILKDQQKIKEAIKFLDQGLLIKPDSPQTNFNKAVMLLGLGEFAQGWALYEWRWKLTEFIEKYNFTNKPRWNGEKDARILIWPEQGIGDEIMFASMFKEVSSDLSDVLIKTDPRLIPIFERTFPNIKFISSKSNVDEKLFTHHLPMGSLAQIYRADRKKFEGKNHAYLKTNDYLDKKISKYFNKSDKYYIGVSWKSVNPLSGLKRSATLEDIIKYVGNYDATYVNLQYGDVDDEINEVKNKMNVDILNIMEIDNKNDVDGLFSIICNCDEVVSIDNSTIHFSGSIGKKTEVLLHSSSDFRWEVEGQNANWYKSVKLTRNIIL